jgi:hypothetical protein
MSGRVWPIEEWKELYDGGISTANIGAKYKCSPGTVLKYLRRVTDIRPARTDTARYTERREAYHFFDSIDTESKAYWLGFIYADGSLSNDGNRLLVYLSDVDTDHLEKLASIFGKRVTVGSYAAHTRAMLTIYSTHVWRQLVSKGIRPNKTYIDTPEVLDHVPQRFMRDFIRGNFDGDGCISTARGYYRVNMIAHKSVITRIRDIVSLEAGVRLNKIQQNSKSPIVHNVMWCGSLQVGNIFRYMYGGATVYMERKYEKFGEVLCTVRGISSYAGVSRHKSRWWATIWVEHKSIYLGTYVTELEAAKVREKYIIDNKIRGQLLNFCLD